MAGPFKDTRGCGWSPPVLSASSIWVWSQAIEAPTKGHWPPWDMWCPLPGRRAPLQGGQDLHRPLSPSSSCLSSAICPLVQWLVGSGGRAGFEAKRLRAEAWAGLWSSRGQRADTTSEQRRKKRLNSNRPGRHAPRSQNTGPREKDSWVMVTSPTTAEPLPHSPPPLSRDQGAVPGRVPGSGWRPLGPGSTCRKVPPLGSGGVRNDSVQGHHPLLPLLQGRPSRPSPSVLSCSWLWPHHSDLCLYPHAWALCMSVSRFSSWFCEDTCLTASRIA